MKQFLRVIRRKSRWLNCDNTQDLSCDVFQDLMPKCCELSVFVVNNEEDKYRVIMALSATRDGLSKLDYIIFEKSIIEPLGIFTNKTDGETPDDCANNLHYLLTNLSALRLANFAEKLNTYKIDTKTRKDIKAELPKFIQENNISKKINKSLLKDLKIE